MTHPISEKSSLLKAAPLFLVIAIDSMGLGILFPILSAMLISHQSHILLAVSIGFVLGPIMGGILSNDHLVSWFTFATPLYFAGILSLLNCIVLYFFFSETFTRTKKIKIRIHYAIQIFIEAFKSKSI